MEIRLCVFLSPFQHYSAPLVECSEREDMVYESESFEIGVIMVVSRSIR